jgi:type II secretory pathway pseudopilin PulG
MVVTIIGIIASIAVPRMSRAAQNAEKNALQATLANVRKAIDVYYAEHGKYPGYTPGTSTPSNSMFVDQLVKYTNESGAASDKPTSAYKYGPYLRSPFPQNPRNNLQTVYVKTQPSDADPAADTFGWMAVLSHGYFGVSLDDTQLGDMGFNGAKEKDAIRGRPTF